MLPLIVLALTSVAVGERLNVAVLESPPFVMIEKDNTTNAITVTGYLIDIWNKVAERAEIESNFYEVADGKYGSLDATTKKWSGLMGDVMTGKADVALAPFTITPNRINEVAFSRPFMPASILAVAKQPPRGEPQQFAEMNDLFAENFEPRVGVIGGGSTYQYFTESSHPLFKAIGASLKADEEGAGNLDGIVDGVEKLRAQELDVIFLEQYMAEFITNREPCDLYIVGQPIGRREYGIAVPRDRIDLMERINSQLVNIQVNDEEHAIRAQWWSRQCKVLRWCSCSGGISSEEKSGEDQRERPRDRIKNPLLCQDEGMEETSAEAVLKAA